MTERKIVYEENPEDVPATPEDIAAEVDSRIGTLLKQIFLAPTVKMKAEIGEQISRLIKECRERLKQFNN